MHFESCKLTFLSRLQAKTGIATAIAQRSGPWILMYHSVLDRPLSSALYDRYVCTRDEFFHHCQGLKSHFMVVPISQLVNAMKKGRELDPRWVSITFDDALVNTHVNAAPILESLGLPWTLCVPAHCVEAGTQVWTYRVRAAVSNIADDKLTQTLKQIFPELELDLSDIRNSLIKHFQVKVPSEERLRLVNLLLNRLNIKDQLHEFDSMNWNAIEELRKNSLVTFALHGGYHFPHNETLSLRSRISETYGAKNILEKHVGPVSIFSMPGGYFPKDISYLVESGFEVILTSQPKRVRPCPGDVQILPRIASEFHWDSLQALMAYKRFQ